MKILLINKFDYIKGGSETYMFSLFDGLVDYGHEASIFSVKDKNNINKENNEFYVNSRNFKGNIIEKTRLFLTMKYSKEAYKKLTIFLNREKPDLVILNLIHKRLTCSIIDAIKDYNSSLPIFWVMHDLIAVCPAYTMLNGDKKICSECIYKGFKACITNKCIKNSYLLSYLAYKEAEYIKRRKFYDDIDLFICPSEFYKKTLLNAGFTKSDIICMRNPLRDSAFIEKENINFNGNYYLYVGRLSFEKGIITMINAFANRKEKLIIVGKGPIENEINQHILNNGIKNVETVGFKSGEELKQIICNSKTVILPSEWYENGPYSAMEAMALGKPLMVSSLGGLPELVKDGENGYIFSDINTLIESLNKMENLDKEKYKDMCLKSYDFAIKNFNMKQYIETLEGEMRRFL